MTRALVLGHSGFIGKELWRALSELDYSLVGVNSNLVRLAQRENRENAITLMKQRCLAC